MLMTAQDGGLCFIGSFDFFFIILFFSFAFEIQLLQRLSKPFFPFDFLSNATHGFQLLHAPQIRPESGDVMFELT